MTKNEFRIRLQTLITEASKTLPMPEVLGVLLAGVVAGYKHFGYSLEEVRQEVEKALKGQVV